MLSDPAGEFDFHFERGRIAGVTIGIAQAGEDFVFHVPRRPHPVQIEVTRTKLPGGDLAEQFLSRRAAGISERAEVTVTVFVLNFLELGDDVIGPLFEFGPSGRGVHQADGREIMAGDVAGQLFAVGPVPRTIRLRFGLEPGAGAEQREHAIGLVAQQVGDVEVLRLFQRTAGEPHGGQRQRLREVRHGVLDRFCGGNPRRAASRRRGS